MSKPLYIVPVEGGFNLFCDGPLAAVCGARRKRGKSVPNGVLRADAKGKPTWNAPGEPWLFRTPSEVCVAAFTIGHYALGFSTLAYTFIDVPYGVSYEVFSHMNPEASERLVTQLDDKINGTYRRLTRHEDVVYLFCGGI